MPSPKNSTGVPYYEQTIKKALQCTRCEKAVGLAESVRFPEQEQRQQRRAQTPILRAFTKPRSFEDYGSSIRTAKGAASVQEGIISHASSADQSRMAGALFFG